MAFDLNYVVEVGFQTILQSERLSIGWLRWYGNFEEPFIDELVVVAFIFFPSVIDIHFQSQKWKLKLFGYEGECF